MLSVQEIENFKVVLLEKKKNLESQLGKIAQKDPNIKDNYNSKFPDYGTGEDDNAHEVGAYSDSLAVEGELENELQKVNKALKKIAENKEYGVCVQCGRAIEKERLNARPQAGRCLKCAS